MFVKILKTAASLWLATFVIVVGMIASGHLLGPRGVEGVLVLPMLLTLTWAAIIYASVTWKRSPKALATSDVAELPARTEEWLEAQRRTLPSAAESQLDAIVLRLEALTPQLQALDPQRPEALEIQRLLGQELPELVQGYQKVPRTLREQSLHGGPSPDRQLVEGLTTVEEAIARIHERLASSDMHALAVQQRYLESKYKADGELD